MLKLVESQLKVKCFKSDFKNLQRWSSTHGCRTEDDFRWNEPSTGSLLSWSSFWTEAPRVVAGRVSADDRRMRRGTLMSIFDSWWSGLPASRTSCVKVASLWSIRHDTGSQCRSWECVGDIDTAVLAGYNSSRSVLYSLQSLDVGRWSSKKNGVGVIKKTAYKWADYRPFNIFWDSWADMPKVPYVIEAGFCDRSRI